jgi:hypothetical protein
LPSPPAVSKLVEVLGTAEMWTLIRRAKGDMVNEFPPGHKVLSAR